MRAKNNKNHIPTIEQTEAERKRLKRSKYYRQALVGTINVLLVVAAVAVLVATLFLPILQVSGTSMEPTFTDGDIIVLFKSKKFETGELIAFHHSGKILIKRVIGIPGDFITMDSEGNVYVNGELLDEPYVTEKTLGDCAIEFPYQVPENSVFVLGDHRNVSVDSRSTEIGSVQYDEIIGKIKVKVWPIEDFTIIK